MMCDIAVCHAMPFLVHSPHGHGYTTASCCDIQRRSGTAAPLFIAIITPLAVPAAYSDNIEEGKKKNTNFSTNVPKRKQTNRGMQ